MTFVLPAERVAENPRHEVGGKGYALSVLIQNRFNVPRTSCVTVGAYRRFLSQSGLTSKILTELHRKKFEEMRWEELWDVSLRIRNMILKIPLPESLAHDLKEHLATFGYNPVAVRSSAVAEDAAGVSFAGLHDSYINVRGAESIIEHIKLVWASLWSDAALLYRKELKLDVESSAMGEVVQEFVPGECSGVIFGMNPLEPSQSVIEAVTGLNQGLVDGTVEPDRWILDRQTGKVLSKKQAFRDKAVQPTASGFRLTEISESGMRREILSDKMIEALFSLVRKAEDLFGNPQDVEWTFRNGVLHVLQSRPITTKKAPDSGDNRSWYLTLRRTFENLQELRIKIEKDVLPQMFQAAEELEKREVKDLPDSKLAKEIRERKSIHEDWVAVYRRDFIPFAHGFRLFGQVYNDKIQPKDPYEFVEVLRPEGMESLERNHLLSQIAGMLAKDKRLAERLKEDRLDEQGDSRFQELWTSFLKKYGTLEIFHEEDAESRKALVAFLMNFSDLDTYQGGAKADLKTRTDLTNRFLSRFTGEESGYAQELLDLGRFSYRLRDEDNIYLGKLERAYNAALKEGKRRLALRHGISAGHLTSDEVTGALENPSMSIREKGSEMNPLQSNSKTPRQLKGQPAGHGLATGRARVIREQRELLRFEEGEILVCDAVEPNMTFVVPMAKGIVERRGGMLIHGAIIAREYGIPCVTGVPDLMTLVKTGDLLTVDGYLGIVVVERLQEE